MAIWSVAQLHLLFAAFVLAVPLFAFIIEVIGYKTGDLRYDRLAHEFTKLLSVSFSLTATFGAFLTFMLIALYPKFTNYLMSVFSPTFLPYVLLFFAEAFFSNLLLRLGEVPSPGSSRPGARPQPRGHGDHVHRQCLAHVHDVAARGLGYRSRNLRLGRRLQLHVDAHQRPSSDRERRVRRIGRRRLRGLQVPPGEIRRGARHYDWMGYIGNFVAISAFLPLPFAGYWLASEIYAYSQTLGLTMMGGAFSWLFIIQAVLIGNLFLAANYYLWLGMGRVEGAQPLQKFIKYLLIGIAVCFAVWATPRSIIATVSEVRAMGGSAHPVLGFLGVMSAKNTAVNILILTTFMSFLLYRRTGKIASVAWAKTGHAAQLTIFAAVAFFVIFLGVYGYFVEASGPDRALGAPGHLGSVRDGIYHRHRHLPLPRREEDRRSTLGQDPRDSSQYVLIFIAVTFTWLMGLMGYVRSGLRQHWHVYGVIRDTSADVFTPTLGFATQVVSVTVLAFFLLIGVVFWITSLHERSRASGPRAVAGRSEAHRRTVSSRGRAAECRH